jgi:mRNA-degrading endonuclease RelE of RelBE toxin-antitoxin system
VEYSWTPGFTRQFKKLTCQDRVRVLDALKKFEDNPYYPSLHTKKLTKTVWQIRVSDSLRLTLEWEGSTVFLRQVGPHDVVQRRRALRG